MLDNTTVKIAGSCFTAICDTSPAIAKEVQPWVETAADTTVASRRNAQQIRLGCGMDFIRWLRAAAAAHAVDTTKTTKFFTSLSRSENQFAERKAEYEAAWNRLVMATQERQKRVGCLVCGSCDNLEFDHIDPTTKISTITGFLRARNYAQAETESVKCNLLCIFHHRQKTQREKDEHSRLAQSERGQRLKERFIAAKVAAAACSVCGLSCTKETVEGFDWARRNPAVRSRRLASVNARASDAKFYEELSKFELLCTPCRKKRTVADRQQGIISKKVRQTRFENIERVGQANVE